MYIQNDFFLTDWSKELIVSGSILGAVIGAAGAGPTSKLFGRKRVLLASDIVFVCGAILMTAAVGLWMLILGRVVVGIGIGLASMVVPMYLAEVAPLRYRGTVVTINVAMITFGQFVSYGLDAAFSFVPGTWRWMLGFSVVPALIQFVGMEMMPESPKWFLFGGREEEAWEVWRQVEGDTKESLHDFEIVKNEVAHQVELEASMTCKSMWTEPGLRRALLVGCGLQMLQQFAGINTVLYYSPTIIQMTGLGGGGNQTAILSSMVVAGMNSVMTLVALPIIDRFGRRVLLLGSLVGTWLALVILALSFWLGTDYAALSLAALVFYTLAFAPGMGPVPWAINAEIYPQAVRERGNSAATITNWASNLLISLTFLSISSALSPTGAFLLYSNIVLLGFCLVLFCVPETKGRSIEQITEYFDSPHTAVPPLFQEPFNSCSPFSNSFDSQHNLINQNPFNE